VVQGRLLTIMPADSRSISKDDNQLPASIDKLHRAYPARDARETAQVYDDWAAEYEQPMKNKYRKN